MDAAGYAWVCHVCKAANPKERVDCATCASPMILGVEEIAVRKRAWLVAAGKLAPPHAPRAMRPPRPIDPFGLGKTFIGRYPLRWTLAAACAVFLPIALLVPGDILEQRWAWSFTQALAAIVPMIDRVVVFNDTQPGKLRFLLALAWTLAPLLAPPLWNRAIRFRHFEFNEKTGLPNAQLSSKEWVLHCMITLLGIWLFWYFPAYWSLGRDVDEPDFLFDKDWRIGLFTPFWMMLVVLLATNLASLLHLRFGKRVRAA